MKINWRSLIFNKELSETFIEQEQSLYKEVGQVVENKRREYGLSRNELALKTKISSPVIEAIEKGWLNKIPEKAYLSSMLVTLEKELNLEKGILKGLIKESKIKHNSKISKGFYFANIDIWNAKQISFLYILLLLLSIFGLNHHQNNVNSLKSRTFKPITSLSKNIAEENETSFTKPEIKGAKESKSLNPSITFISNIIPRLLFQSQQSWLEINLNNPKKIKLSDKNGYEVLFKKAEGYIKLKLHPPIILEISPPLDKSERVIWKGSEYIIPKDNKGTYLIEDSSNQKSLPSKPLPQ